MNLTESEIEILKYEVESLDMSWHEDYQVRFMTQAKYAVSGSRAQFSSLLSNLISMLKYAALDDEIDEVDGYENILAWLLAARTDSLGHGLIWY